MKLSVVATLYNTGCYLGEFHARISEAAAGITQDCEIVLVNDGSPDNALEIAVELSQRDPRVLVMDLSRNFGHHRAIMAGLGAASGDLVFLINSDLEEPPEALNDFYAALQAQKCDVVYGYQAKRRGSWLDSATGAFYYQLVRFLADVDLPKNLITARLMTRRYVKSLLRHGEREMFIAGLWAATGYRQVGIPVTKLRNAPSSYTFWRRVSVLLISVISYSEKPLALIAVLGAAISCISLAVIAYLIVRHLQFHSVPGWASVVASIWLLGGMTIAFLGLIGLYISKIFIEVKQRPYVIVRDMYRNGEPEEQS